jgi:hypothetical protein
MFSKVVVVNSKIKKLNVNDAKVQNKNHDDCNKRELREL